MNSKYDSLRICIPSDTMAIEIVQGEKETRMYLNMMICPVCVDEDEAIFSYYISDTKFEGSATAMEGGQRLLVSDRDMANITHALMNEESVRIKVGMYDDVFESGNFPSFAELLEL